MPTNDIVIPPTPEPSSTSGCEACGLRPAPAGPSIALIQRGTCTLAVKVANAEAAGYDAVLFFNEGQPGRTDLPAGTLGAPADIPVIGLTLRGRRRSCTRPPRPARSPVRVFAVDRGRPGPQDRPM